MGPCGTTQEQESKWGKPKQKDQLTGSGFFPKARIGLWWDCHQIWIISQPAWLQLQFKRPSSFISWTTFLNGHLEEEVFTSQPEGFRKRTLCPQIEIVPVWTKAISQMLTFHAGCTCNPPERHWPMHLHLNRGDDFVITTERLEQMEAAHSLMWRILAGYYSLTPRLNCAGKGESLVSTALQLPNYLQHSRDSRYSLT